MTGNRTGRPGIAAGMAMVRGAVVAALAAGALGLAGCSGGSEVAGDAAPVQVGTPTGAPAGTPAVSPTATASVPPATATASPLSGRPYGIVTAVDPGRSTITVNVVDWFGGDAARRACAEDGVKPSGAWCVQYYFRDVNPLLRTLRVAAGADVTVLKPTDAGLTETPADLAAVRAGLRSMDVYRLRVTGGVVTAMDPQYRP